MSVDPRAALEAKMREASRLLVEIDDSIPALYPKAFGTLSVLSGMIATLDEFAESIKVERAGDAAQKETER